MPSNSISFRDTNYFSALICDYLDEKQELGAFYNRFPRVENFKDQIIEKAKNFSPEHREVLENALQDQYKNVDATLKTRNNIISLKSSDTFTITTGHQLNLFTGPLYFLYKIISTINLTRQLKTAYPDYNFLPVYWMATEDHDFEEINYFNFKGRKVQWSRDTSGAVGQLDTDGLMHVAEVFSKQLGEHENAKRLKDLFKKAYTEFDTLTASTRYLANALFGEYGLVIIDGDDQALKGLFVPYIEKEVTAKCSFTAVSESNSQIKALDYKVQVNPREINLFYLTDGLRERIVASEGHYSVQKTKVSWTENEILAEINRHPERFSPNVIMRPLYQEVILPNLCYIGGGGELAYWLQLKTYFDSVKVTFPILLLRNSVLLTSAKHLEKMQKLDLNVADLFLDQQDLISIETKKRSTFSIDFSDQKELLKNQFKALYDLAGKTDKSFLGAVGAQERKQIKGLEHLEKRLLKAQKKQLAGQLERIMAIQDALFPGQSLQERNMNFSEFYLEYGDTLIPKLQEALEPLKLSFLVLEL